MAARLVPAVHGGRIRRAYQDTNVTGKTGALAGGLPDNAWNRAGGYYWHYYFIVTMIEFQHVFKSYGRGRNILADINFRIEPGEFIFVSGPSGAGKSTLLKLIGGLEPSSRGSVHVNGHRIDKMPARARPYLRRAVGVILQDTHLLYDRNAIENILLPLTVVGLGSNQALTRARAAVEKVGLSGKEMLNPVEMSGGEQQRLAIARAIVNRPAILIADEPTASLDQDSARRIMDVFRDFNRVGVTTLIASHDVRLMASYATRTLHIDHSGRFSDAKGVAA